MIEVLALVAIGISCAGAVAAAWFARRAAQSASDADVTALAHEVERLAKLARRERMQRVRAAAGDVVLDPASAAAGATGESAELPSGDRKAALRARLRAKLNGRITA